MSRPPYGGDLRGGSPDGPSPREDAPVTYNVDEMVYRRAAAMWAFVVQMQGDRLDEAASSYNAAVQDQLWLDQREAGTLPADWASYVENEVGSGLNWATTWTFGADQYYFLDAVAQLRKCVRALPYDGLPDVPDERMVLLLRNFTEHWEDPTGWSAVELRRQTPDAQPGRATYTSKDIWIEGVSTSALVSGAGDVDRALRAGAAATGNRLPAPDERPPGV